MSRAFFPALLVGLAVAGGGHANPVRCAQQALLDNGFDPNGVDGAIGSGTRAAADRFRSETGSNLPALTPSTAEVWCRALAIAPGIVKDMREICEEDGHSVEEMPVISGEWYQNGEPELPFAIFVQGKNGAGKTTGYYATPLHDGWYQSRSCVYFVGSVQDDGSLKFLTTNNGRIERRVPGFETPSDYIEGVEWISKYGNTTGWARFFPEVQ